MQADILRTAFIITRPGRFDFFDIPLCGQLPAGCANFPPRPNTRGGSLSPHEGCRGKPYLDDHA